MLVFFLKMPRHVPSFSSPYLSLAKSRRVILLLDLRCAMYLSYQVAKQSLTVSPTHTVQLTMQIALSEGICRFTEHFNPFQAIL